MNENTTGAMIAIDWENIRRGAQLYQRRVRPSELCLAIRNVACIFGEVLGGKAFGDWSLRPDDGREFAEHGITPYHAPRSSAGKDRSGHPAGGLRVGSDRDDCGTVILRSEDADYQVLVDQARTYGKRIVLCAFSASVSRDMLATAPLFPLEAELGIQTAEHGDVKLDLAAASESDDAESNDVLARFVRQMYNLESCMNFVGYGMLCNRWMLDWGLAWNEYECRKLIDEYQEAGIVEHHDVFNPNNPDWPTGAVRLVLTDERVRRALGFSDGPASNPVLSNDAAPVQHGSAG